MYIGLLCIQPGYVIRYKRAGHGWIHHGIYKQALRGV